MEPAPISPTASCGAAKPVACVCGVMVTFGRCQVSGKLQPFERDDDGEWIVFGEIASHQGKAPWRNLGMEPGVPRYTSHLELCPRKRRGRRRK